MRLIYILQSIPNLPIQLLIGIYLYVEMRNNTSSDEMQERSINDLINELFPKLINIYPQEVQAFVAILFYATLIIRFIIL